MKTLITAAKVVWFAVMAVGLTMAGIGLAMAIIGPYVVDPHSTVAARPAEAQNSPAIAQRELDWKVAILAMRGLKASLHDPNSLEVLQVLRMNDKSLCITYRARNGFNALRQSHTVVAPRSAASEGDPRFYSLWNRHCNGKHGEDITEVKYAI
jgi:hypothetical protein